MTTPSILFVGESPPAGAPADFIPFDCASGTRLATIMLGLRDRQTMLDLVPRANIYDTPTGAKGCADAWEPMMATARGTDLLYRYGGHGTKVFVALGRRTAEALCMPDSVRVPSYNWAPAIGTTWKAQSTCIYAPHPSGQSQTLNDPTIRAEVRAMLMPEIILGVPALRPWHFRLDDPTTLATVAAAVAPLCPALGAAALVYADAMHKARVARMALPIFMHDQAIDGPPMAGKTPHVPAWDNPMSTVAAVLLNHDGGRALAKWWGLTPMQIVKDAKPHAALNRSTTIAAMRATLARYAAAGLA